jgi:hypothetical protein
MHSQDKGTKRARTQQQDGAGALDNLPGREQLLLAAPELETDRTIQIEVGSLGGDSFKIILDESLPTVGKAKAEIARVQGTRRGKQELYKVATRADGGAVREDDAEPELLDDDDMKLRDGEIVAMAVKEDVIATKDAYDYTLLQDIKGLSKIIFSVCANNNAHVGLSPSLDHGGQKLEIVLGGWRNTASQVSLH